MKFIGPIKCFAGMCGEIVGILPEMFDRIKEAAVSIGVVVLRLVVLFAFPISYPILLLWAKWYYPIAVKKVKERREEAMKSFTGRGKE